MSLKDSLRKKTLISFVLVLVLLLFLLFGWQKFQNKLALLVFSFGNKQNIQEIINQKKDRISVYSETSPDGVRQIILYEMPFTGNGQLEYYNYLSSQYFFAVKELASGREQYIFVNDYKTGYPHWLGNDYIFFTSGCGSGCQGLYLVDTRSKESRLAMLTTTPLTKDTFETHFRDWFNQEFRFPGWTKHIRSVLLEDKIYLIFQMWDNNQPAGEKKFLFTENSLKEK